MKTLIKSAKIIDQVSAFNGKSKNILIEDGIITDISDDLHEADQTINAEGMLLSIGWFDMRATFCDPGLEHREDLNSGSEAAAVAGFTEVALLPNTRPVVQTKNEIGYIKSGNHKRLSQLYPMGTVTLGAKGEELTEMIDLHTSGAIAFTDGEQPIWHADILLKTLQYLQKFDGLLINKPEDKHLNMFGSMNEGVHSTVLGMKGMPKLAEEIIIARDLMLLEYAGGKIHFSNISTSKSVQLIREAKQKGLQVTCDIAAFQPLFDDSALSGFDSKYKVNPPFREEEDNDALIQGLKDGTIDVVVSSHTPQEEENKKLEFDLAEFGVISLQTVGSNLNVLSNKVGLEKLIEKVTYTPRKILNVDLPEIKVGAIANLTLFDPKREWEFNGKSNKSKSNNSPFWEQTLVGKAVGTFNNKKSWIDQEIV